MRLPRIKNIRFWFFAVTFLSTSLSGFYLAKQLDPDTPVNLFSGLPYAVSLMIILGCHEAGHYFAARWWGLKKVTPPLFIPLPFTSLGTMGAVISIDEPFPNRKVLFDVGMAGPWAGLLAAIGFLLFADTASSPLYVFAATIGVLITFLNLFPFGPLDGGLVFYAVAAGKSDGFKNFFIVSFMLYAVFIQKIVSPWILMLIIVLFGLKHPPTQNDETPLGRPRELIAWLTFIMFLALDVFGRQLINRILNS